MELKIYSIKDAKTGTYTQPFFQLTPGEAERNFKTLVNDPKSVQYQYPEDFSLWEIGSYNDASGAIEGKNPSHIVNAAQLKQVVQ